MSHGLRPQRSLISNKWLKTGAPYQKKVLKQVPFISIKKTQINLTSKEEQTGAILDLFLKLKFYFK